MVNTLSGKLLVENEKFCIIISRFNEFIGGKLLSGAIDELKRHGVEENNIDVQMGKNECLQKILETVNENLISIKTVEDITRLTHFSASYIHQLFKKHLNITPHKYLTVKKMENARALLVAGCSISEACFGSGFDNYANFITGFKKHFGVTPTQYKQKKETL